jgi:excisionase family DNA binding protein
MTIPDGDLLITPQQIVEELQGMVTPYTVTRWCRSGKLKATRAGRKWLIRKADFDEFLKKGGENSTKKADGLALAW